MEDGPRIRALLESDDPLAAEAALWADLRSVGTPLIEPHPDDPDACLVTFLWYADRPVERVVVNEAVSSLPPEARALSLAPGTFTWFATWPVKSDVRTTYHFEVFAGSGSERIGDEHARVREPHDYSVLGSPESVLVCPGAEPLSWADRRPDTPRGTVTGAVLGDGREVWVYTPPGYDHLADPPGVLVVLDGHAQHSAVTVLDNLHADRRIEPTAAILVGQLDRNAELTCDADFSRFLAEGLLPWAREAYRLTADPARTVIAGCSLGGLCAAYTGLRHPEVFGNVLMLSGSVWWDPDTLREYFQLAGSGPRAIGARSRTPAIIGEYTRAERAPIRIYQDVGAFETGPPPATPHQIHASRHFRDVLTLKGYDYVYREFAGGHDETWWRSRLGDGLIWLTDPRGADRG
ncbi:alpha/beta hydrolase-fold protein [Nonomuraea muscovyensis]|uniref:alpha/beta hydrolase n=1 Tax=Nonomuraea muscovyensis TaxID=1124761 RepID=UPI0033CC39F5